MTHEWRVAIYSEPCSAATCITFYEVRGGKTYIAQPCELSLVEALETGVVVVPTLRLAQSVAGPFLKAFAEALDKQDIKTDKDATIAGALAAQTYHLNDLRKLLALDKPS